MAKNFCSNCGKKLESPVEVDIGYCYECRECTCEGCEYQGDEEMCECCVVNGVF